MPTISVKSSQKLLLFSQVISTFSWFPILIALPPFLVGAGKTLEIYQA
ncbi:MAG: hypothetical protein N3E45_07870 [Oscillatoriaceae bacterium SKW80]|nr:hypothetical protein [Oscillatoriaceae bacterium SKYG93]MCX8120735.1 hypothetical protein [Oscillatoriaceae bacterium SKW80]MDW8453727.1 hypothetical protein [Oscillatoriaceae cyanobacterium SKYGB_i_bin93]HIK26959.1 hypothetical protein [Oscillatoriaceae cyanobacterium M7585_C2015_266]